MSMRVQYTLPGFLPAESLPAAETADAPFSSKLQLPPVMRGPSWQSVLQLDEDPTDATSLEAPPRLLALDIKDAASERWNWMEMLNRLSGNSGDNPAESSANGNGNRAIARMLALLKKFQEAENCISARSLGEVEE